MANAGAGASGALSGAASGAAIGSVVPGIGTAIGAVGGALVGGLSGLFSGSSTPAASAAPIIDPVTGQQIQDANGTATGAIAQQQAFLNSLNAQNGIGNQSQVYNQLQGVANGTGPNPAQAMLAQQTGQNAAQQGALMASQRGVGANPALLARQAAMQGANIQQQGVGQAATLQANQSLSALQQLSGVAQNQVANQAGAVQGLNSTAQNQQAALLGAQSQFNQAQVGSQGSVNSANAPLNLSNQQYGQNITGGLLSGAGSVATALKPGAATNNLTPTSTTTLPASNPAPSLPVAAKGGMVMLADGGKIPPKFKQEYPGVAYDVETPTKDWQKQNRPKDAASPQDVGPAQMPAQPTGDINSDNYDPMMDPVLNAKKMAAGGMARSKAFGHLNPIAKFASGGMAMFASGGKVPALVSPGEKYLPPKEVKKVAEGKKSAINAGHTIPGKPKVGGAKNDYANDTVRKTLDAGGIVLPRSVTQAKDPAKAAHAFVSAIIAKKGLKH